MIRKGNWLALVHHRTEAYLMSRDSVNRTYPLKPVMMSRTHLTCLFPAHFPPADVRRRGLSSLSPRGTTSAKPLCPSDGKLRAVDEANGIVRSKRDAFVDTVLNQLKGMTDDGLTFGQYTAEISVVNRKRAVFLEFSPDIGRKHSSDAGSTCFGQWALQLADDSGPVLCADPLSVSLPNCFGA